MYRTVFWTLWKRERVGWFGRMALITYNIIYEMSRQSRFNARYWMLGVGALGRPRGRVWGGRREEGSGWGTHVYLWRIHFDIWQNQYNIVKLKKIKNKKKRKFTQRTPSFCLKLCTSINLKKNHFLLGLLYSWSSSSLTSLRLHGRQKKQKAFARLLCPWNSPVKNTGLGCRFLLQGNFLTQRLNLGLPHCRQTSYI